MALHTDPKKVAKAIMPAGFTTGYYPGIYTWRKAHGHAGGRMIERALDKARALGFVDGAHQDFNTPDGSVIGSKSKMHHPDGWELEHYSSYGCVAYDNSFSMTLRKVVQETVSA
jgi:hypothetical protein